MADETPTTGPTPGTAAHSNTPACLSPLDVPGGVAWRTRVPGTDEWTEAIFTRPPHYSSPPAASSTSQQPPAAPYAPEAPDMASDTQNKFSPLSEAHKTKGTNS